MVKKLLAFFFLGLVMLFFLVYLGLNVAERGLHELLALEKPCRAMHIEQLGGETVFYFAGGSYRFPHRFYLQKLKELHGRIVTFPGE